MAEGQTTRWSALMVMAVVACVGCAGLPTSGPVHVGRALPAAAGDPDLRALPPVPRPDMAPDAVVGGFLQALVNDDSNYLIARQYLTTTAAAAWNATNGITTYDDASLTVESITGTGSSRVVHLRMTGIGHIDARGDYVSAGQTLRQSFTLTRQSGQWRIDRLPAGVLLSQVDAQRSLRLAPVYFLSRVRQTLVPEQLLLPNHQNGLATALVRALLAGPGSWLAPAVRTAAPPGTSLVGNVPVDSSGVADVNLSTTVRQASGAELKELAAQIIWTLKQVTDITTVRLFTDGSPLAVPDAPLREPTTSWEGFDPDAPPSAPAAVYVTDHRLVALGNAAPGLERVAGVVSAATVSPDGRSLAVVRPTRRGVVLLVGPAAGPLEPKLSAAALTPPTFSPDGDVYTVATQAGKQRLVQVGHGGHVSTAGGDRALLEQRVQQLRISRDGARFAAVVGSKSGHLFVGRLTGPPSALSFTAPRPVAPELTNVEGLAWHSADELAVTAAAGARREIVLVDVDGYATKPITADAITGSPDDVAAAPGQPLLVGTSGGLLFIDSSGWQPVGTRSGSAPAYPD